MLILVANLGSTSFKYKLFDFPSERVLAVGAADRIGQGDSAWSVEADGREVSGTIDLADHAAAVALHLEQLVKLGAIASIEAVEAIGFKAVHGGPISGAVEVDDKVLATMQDFADVAPAHNPPYIAAMKGFAAKLPGVRQVAAFETAFHQTIPMSRQVYGVPWEWTEAGVRRFGFHGASHRYIATRMSEIAPDCRKIISCHLGGSCSICAIENGQSVANSFGTTPQSGVFHNNRVGDFDAFALLKAMNLLSVQGDLEKAMHLMGKQGGLLGISGVSPDLREVQAAAAEGNERAKLAIDAFIESIRHYVGAYLAILNGCDALVFTGGIGQHNTPIRDAVCQNMDYAGIMLDAQKSKQAKGSKETRIDKQGKVAIWVVPTNEELIVARQTYDVLATVST